VSDLYPAERLELARRATAEAGLDALLLTPGADLRYLTGYPALALERLTCLLLPATGPATLLVPELEAPAALVSPVGRLPVEVVSHGETAAADGEAGVGGSDPFRLAADLLTRALGRPPRRVGLADRMWAEQVLNFRRAMPDAEQLPAGTVLRRLRCRKSPAEVAALATAGAAIDRVHEQVPGWLRPGRTELEVAADIADAIVAAGHQRVNFVIVASGPNSASPHHQPAQRRLRRGEPVVIDIGGTTAEGYCSDATRTYAVGAPPAGFAELYAVLRGAQQAGCAAAAPGVPAERVDAAAREVIAAAGYGDRFVHRTGHGIGLDEHEEPWIAPGNPMPLAPGMAFSVEPGIYLPGRYGARIEDVLVCTDTGSMAVNRARHDLVVVDG